jgi:hypothetical protein
MFGKSALVAAGLSTWLTGCSRSPQTVVPVINLATGLSRISATVYNNDGFAIYAARGGKSYQLLDLNLDLREQHEVTAAADEIQSSNGRMVLAQLSIADGPYRQISAWLVDAANDKVLWQGEGSSSGLGVCEELTNIPKAEMDGNSVVIRLHSATVVKESDVTAKCRASAPVIREVFRQPLHDR